VYGVAVFLGPCCVSDDQNRDVWFRLVTRFRYVVPISRAKGRLALMQIAPVADQIRTLVLQREDF